MTKPQNSTAGPGRWVYPVLLAMQTIGIVVFYWKGVPLYRQLAADPTAYEIWVEAPSWALLATALIQVGYWIRYQVRPALPHFVNPLVGHLVLFVARLSFTFATAVFSFLFITKEVKFQTPVSRYALTIAGLFSLFCYMLELQRLGSALLGPKKKTDAPAR